MEGAWPSTKLFRSERPPYSVVERNDVKKAGQKKKDSLLSLVHRW